LKAPSVIGEGPILIIVADNIQIRSQRIIGALETRNPGPIQKLVERCIGAGANALDINSGPLLRDPEKDMTFLVESVQEVSDLTLVLDTLNPKAVEAGLIACKTKAVINGFSLQPERLEHVLPLARKYDADIIGYLLLPNGHVPPDASQRLNIALDLYTKCIEAGIDKEQLIIDPVVAPILWQNGNRQAREVLTVIRTLPELLGFRVRTIAGISNLTTGSGDRDKKLVLEQSYVAMLAEAGLDMALVNVFHHSTISVINACNCLRGDRIFAWAEI
jgi:5-methyltetrahydrofolate corrinoid/iron sulfur protein methyltransferase